MLLHERLHAGYERCHRVHVVVQECRTLRNEAQRTPCQTALRDHGTRVPSRARPGTRARKRQPHTPYAFPSPFRARSTSTLCTLDRHGCRMASVHPTPRDMLHLQRCTVLARKEARQTAR